MLLRQALAGCPPTVIETAELLADEVVTNAVKHAQTALVLQIDLDQPGFRVVVEDTSVDAPVPQPSPAPDADNGRGLHLVATLAADWGWERTTAGKRVWFEL